MVKSHPCYWWQHQSIGPSNWMPEEIAGMPGQEDLLALRVSIGKISKNANLSLWTVSVQLAVP